MIEPLSNADAQKTVRAFIAGGGVVFFTAHAQRAMADDGMVAADVLNVLKAGWCESSEYENGAWRYRFVTNRHAVIVEFEWEPETLVIVVTVWRF